MRRVKIFLFVFMSMVAVLPLAPARAAGADDTVGQLYSYTVQKKENLYDIARRYDIGTAALVAANPGVSPHKPKPGTKLLLPTMQVMPDAAREGIVINLAERRLYFFGADGKALSFPVAVGKKDWETPTGATKIYRKRKNPVWTPTDSIRAENPNLPEKIGPGPDNPLGDRAMDLGWPGYLIHGTNSPRSIGRAGTHGCVRMYTEDVEKLFDLVEKGTSVTVVNEIYKLGWWQDKLLLQVLPTAAKEQDSLGTRIYESARAMAGTRKLDWQAVDIAIKNHNGIPVILTLPGMAASVSLPH